jgi:hypothetical protein
MSILDADSSSGMPLANGATLADAAAGSGLTDGDRATMYFVMTIVTIAVVGVNSCRPKGDYAKGIYLAAQ